MKPYNIDNSLSTNERLKQLLPGGRHSNYLDTDTIPELHFSKGKGCRLWDIDGNEYLDLNGNHGSQFLGHCHPEYNQILYEQMQNVLSVNHIELECEIYDTLSYYIPSCEMVRFSLSGSEAIQNAIRLARAYTQKSGIVKFKGHFHGTADVMLDRNDIYLLEWNNINELKKLVDNKCSCIAAIIMEPLCMSAGAICPRKNYLRAVRELCSKNNIILIFDEVITGIRAGLGGMQKIYEVNPDLSIFSKGIGNGIPISILFGKKAIMQLYQRNSVIQGGTYNGYPLGLTAIKALLKILTASDHYTRMRSMNAKIIQILIKNAQVHDMDLCIQGSDNCFSLSYSKQPIDTYEQWVTTIKNNAVIRACLQRYGIMLASVSRIYPSISLTENDLDFLSEKSLYAFAEAKLLLNKIN